MSIIYCKREKESVQDYIFRKSKGQAGSVTLSTQDATALLEYVGTISPSMRLDERQKLEEAIKTQNPGLYLENHRIYGVKILIAKYGRPKEQRIIKPVVEVKKPVSEEDKQNILALIKERYRLRREAKKLLNKEIADIYGLSKNEVNLIEEEYKKLCEDM